MAPDQLSPSQCWFIQFSGDSSRGWPYWLYMGSQERISNTIQDHLHARSQQSHGQPFSQHLHWGHCSHSHRQVQIVLPLHWQGGGASGDSVSGKKNVKFLNKMVRKGLVEQLDSLNDILHFTFCFTENYIYICQFRKHSHPLLDAVNTISFQNCTDLIQRKNCNELQLIGSEAQSTYKCQPIIESFHVVNKSKGKFNYFPD